MHVVNMETGGSLGEQNGSSTSHSEVQSIDTGAAGCGAENTDVHMEDVIKTELKSPPSAGPRRGRRRRGAAGGGQMTLAGFMARTRKGRDNQPQANGVVKESPEGKENVDEEAAMKKIKTDKDETKEIK